VTVKSPDAFRTISEVAAELDLPQHVLRFWETRFPSIKPLKRGGGRRYYRPDDVDLLKGIRHLLYGQGYTIKGVQRIIKEDGNRFVQALGRGEGQAPRPREGELADVDDGELEPTTEDDEIGTEDSTGPEPSARRADGAGRPAPLPSEELDRLASVLDELLECERILHSLDDHDPMADRTKSDDPSA
jgi:DNA-binding transcriptional MerR regulator